ncbi:MAG TPA: hypothetical protein VE198_06740 [Actinoallomurus sp.]|nr:hypothetical protein [Actinoallomurus sp.]
MRHIEIRRAAGLRITSIAAAHAAASAPFGVTTVSGVVNAT